MKKNLKKLKKIIFRLNPEIDDWVICSACGNNSGIKEAGDTCEHCKHIQEVEKAHGRVTCCGIYHNAHKINLEDVMSLLTNGNIVIDTYFQFRIVGSGRPGAECRWNPKKELDKQQSKTINWLLKMFVEQIGGENINGLENYWEARKIVIEEQKCSASLLQRKLMISYREAWELMDELEDGGIIGPDKSPKYRDVLIKP